MHSRYMYLQTCKSWVGLNALHVDGHINAAVYTLNCIEYYATGDAKKTQSFEFFMNMNFTLSLS